MNFKIRIYPEIELAQNSTWGKIEEMYVELLTLLGYTNKKNLGFNLVDFDNDRGRLVLRNISSLNILSPSRILKSVSNKPEIELRNNERLVEGENYATIRYVYDRWIEMPHNNSVINWTIDYGIEGLYEINEESLEVVDSRMLNDEKFKSYKSAIEKYNYLIELQTDLSETNKNVSILLISLVFCRLIKGVIFVEHSFDNSFYISMGYYTCEEFYFLLEQVFNE